MNRRSFIMLSVSSFVPAAVVKGAAKTKKRKPLNGTFEGEIIGRSSKSITFKTPGGLAYTANLGTSTVISAGERKGSVGDLAVGQQVKVTVKTDRAERIEVLIANAK
jgi:hypothetical protein